jgi:tetratricopeptide (TPR) repeat protein
VTVDEDRRSEWDFFVSYTPADRAWAEWIAWTLEEDGHRVLIQAWDFVPGSNWVQGMQAGTRDAARIIAVLSDSYLESVYGGAEWQAAWARDPAGTDRKLLTVRVTACDRPGLLAGVVGVDLFGRTEAEAKAQLREMLAAAVSGRAKPTAPPGFPGACRAMPHPARFPATMPQVWKVPPRNPNFTGRGPDLDGLARALRSGPAVTVHAVHGMGGVGKTQLAAEYAHAHAGDYDLVWWIAAEVPAALPDQFAALAAQLGLDPPAAPEGLRAQVHERLRSVPGWLLIFDNAEAVADIAPWLPAGPLPPGIPAHVVVTTRRAGFAALGRVMELEVIGLPDAVRLLQARVSGLGQEVAEQIAGELGRLPLALEQAAAYLDQSQRPAQEYLELLRRRAADLYRRGQVAGRAETIATLWDLSLERIAGEDAAAVQLLGVCAYVAPEPIPVDLFTSDPGLLPDPLRSAASDQLAFGDTIAVLVDYSLAKRTAAGLQLHRLVQAAIRSRYDQPGTAQDAAAPKRRLTMRDEAAGQADHPLAVTLRLLRAGAPAEITRSPQNWPKWAVLLPHVLAAVTHFDRALGQPGPDTVADAAWLLDQAGAYLRVQARFTDAKAVLEQALAIDEAAYGPDHPNVAVGLNNLALILCDLGQPEAARPLQERTLTIFESAYGPDHPQVAIALSVLALILKDLKQPGEARPLLERALTIFESADQPDHREIADDLSVLAGVLVDLGQPQEARPLQERAVAIAEAEYGPDHPHVARYLNYLAGIQRDLGQPDKARPQIERALAIDEAAHGPDHPDTARDLNTLAGTLQELGHPDEARLRIERALAIDEAAYRPPHPAIAHDLNTLAAILRDLGQPAEAQALQERALDMTKAAQSARPALPREEEGG